MVVDEFVPFVLCAVARFSDSTVDIVLSSDRNSSISLEKLLWGVLMFEKSEKRKKESLEEVSYFSDQKGYFSMAYSLTESMIFCVIVMPIAFSSPPVMNSTSDGVISTLKETVSFRQHEEEESKEEFCKELLLAYNNLARYRGYDLYDEYIPTVFDSYEVPIEQLDMKVNGLKATFSLPPGQEDYDALRALTFAEEEMPKEEEQFDIEMQEVVDEPIDDGTFPKTALPEGSCLRKSRDFCNRCLTFKWYPTFMRLTLLSPRVVLWALVFLPFCAIFGFILVPIVGLLITVTPAGKRGMYQHENNHDVSKEVWSCVMWICVMFTIFFVIPSNMEDMMLAVLLCIAFIFLPLVIAMFSTIRETAMYLSGPSVKLASAETVSDLWDWFFFLSNAVRKNVSNAVAIVSILFEHIQLLALSCSAALPELSMDSSWFGVIVRLSITPFGLSVITQVIVAGVLSSLLVGFLAISIILTGQSEKRVARVSEKRELEGNLSLFKLLIAILADTLFLSISSSFANLASESIKMNSKAVGNITLFVSLIAFLGYSYCSILIVLPIQAIFPRIWIPEGTDVRAAPLFSLVERSGKLVLVTALNLFSTSNVSLRSIVVSSVLLSVLCVSLLFDRYMTKQLACDYRRFSYSSSFGTVLFLWIFGQYTAVDSSSMALYAILWISSQLLLFIGSSVFRRWRRRDVRRKAVNKLGSELCEYGISIINNNNCSI